MQMTSPLSVKVVALFSSGLLRIDPSSTEVESNAFYAGAAQGSYEQREGQQDH